MWNKVHIQQYVVANTLFKNLFADTVTKHETIIWIQRWAKAKSSLKVFFMFKPADAFKTMQRKYNNLVSFY